MRAAAAIALVYVVIALGMTWPLAAHPASQIAGDLGDPVFNSWVLMWTAGVALAVASGDIGAWHQYWNGNIFHPEPLTIAYSEHLTPQMLQMLPVYAAGGNILLCYNLLFLSTFVVAAFGTYLFVRDLTGRPLAAFVAGLAFAFAPYRIGQFSHLQVLSSGWMPLALLGFRRYFVTGRARTLAGGTAALAVQCLSCGYYLVFFPPFVAAYGLYEMTRRRLLREWRVWLSLAAAALGLCLAIAPFVAPYLRLNAQGNGLGVRSPEEVVMFSADTHAFATVSETARVLRHALPGFPKAEGEGFPGFTILALASIGTIAATGRATRHLLRRTSPSWIRPLFWAGSLIFAVYLVEALWILANGELAISTTHSLTIIRNAGTPLWRATLLFAVLGAIVAFTSRADAPPDEAAAGFFACAAAVAALLALGPELQSAGHPVGYGPYGWLFEHVPGFNGLRVPARFLTVVTLFMAILAGLGAATLLRLRFLRIGAALVIAAGAGVLAESWIAPMATNVPVVPEKFVPPAPLTAGRHISPLYQLVRSLPEPVVLAEFPFGEPAYEIRATYYAGYHRRPIINGYSGYFPASYLDRVPVLSAAPANPEAVTAVLAEAGVTHVLVHEAAFPGSRGRELSDWFVSTGARLIAADGRDRLLALAGARRPTDQGAAR